MTFKQMQRLLVVFRVTLEIVLCKHINTLVSLSCLLLTLPLAHIIGRTAGVHVQWDGQTLPWITLWAQAAVGYLFAAVVTGNVFLVYAVVSPVLRWLRFARVAIRVLMHPPTAVCFNHADHNP